MDGSTVIKSIYSPTDLSLNEAGRDISFKAKEFFKTILQEYPKHNPREMVELLSGEFHMMAARRILEQRRMMNKPNRAHYRLETNMGQEGWAPTDRHLCVFHSRRIDRHAFRPVAIKSYNGMSRPSDLPCTDCISDKNRCEHDMQNAACPHTPGDTCGRDSDDELGGSW